MSSSLKNAAIYVRVSTLEQTQTSTDDLGYSLRAQEEACRNEADRLGAAVLDVYIERAESARSANRPQLQKMLTRIREDQDLDLVIVYKVDRFARNRLEDGLLLADLKAHNVELISATENIDDTAEGRMMHGILATFAEYEVAKLGNRTEAGMHQKARMGGTPNRAPLGYLNVRRQLPDGREIRVVDIDDERGHHIQWAFREYATGEHSLVDMTLLLENQGLVSRPSRRHGMPKPISKSQINRILRDPYYTGKVRYRNEIFDGIHEPLVSQELFDRVQDILTSRHTSGTRRRLHDHPLKGSLTCKHCEGRMYLSMAKNRHGTTYP